MSRVYISGPINGVEGYIDNFKAAEKYLLDKGHEVINPVAVSDALPNMEYEELMALDIMLLFCTLNDASFFTLKSAVSA